MILPWEVSRARRALSKAKLALENQKNKLSETAYLLKQGIIPALEYEAAEHQFRNQKLDFDSAKQDLEIVLAKGSHDARRVARLELDNARSRVQVLEETLQKAVVSAPIVGVILNPRRSGGDQPNKGGELLTRGRSVQQGELLLTIGDFEGMSVVASVDEVDISKIRLAQPARVSGDAFPDLKLRGIVTHVSSEARKGQSRKALPSFDIIVALDDLSAAHRQRLRLGMSTNLEVVVYDKPDALLVPIDAVEVRGDKSWLLVRDRQTGAVQRLEVVTGLTTLDAVEIVRGLKPNDEVVISRT